MWKRQSRLLLILLSCMGTIVHPAITTKTTSTKNNNVVHNVEETIGANVPPHFDPNEEDHDGMIYMGRVHYENGTRVGFDYDNSIKYIFGTSFDESHKHIEEKDLLHHDFRSHHDVPNRQDDEHVQAKTREQVLMERRHGKVSQEGPKPFGHVDTHELDGGVVPPKVVSVEPYFLDANLVTNKEFGKFVRSTYYETEAEHFGWSFVVESFVSSSEHNNHDKDPDAEHWVAVDGAYWRRPEGPKSSYKYRENHPVVHVSHRDAAEYCKWVGKRLPGEREWEAAARGGYWHPSNRTLYTWGNDELSATEHANLWQGEFPFENLAKDGWRGTSPIQTYPPNELGFYDLIGNVWEWQRGGKHKERIVRGGSFVDTVDGQFNHAATNGARATLHGTTTTGNIGFRCAKPPKRRVEHHYVYHDEVTQGQLAIEDQYGKRDMIPQRNWEDQFQVVDDDDEDEMGDENVDEYLSRRKKRKVVKERTTISTEL